MKGFGRILFWALMIGGIVYAIIDDSPVPPSADAQKPVALACLKRADFKADWDVPTGVARDVEWVLHVEDGDGIRVAIIYLADLRADLDVLADRLEEDQETYGDYKGETIEHRGTSVVRLRKGYVRAGGIRECMDRAAKAEET
jgi:hypothetical protein